jgi:chlorite dismutase
MEFKKSFTYSLLQSVNVSINGKVEEAHSMEIFAPITTIFKDVNIIDVEFNQSESEGIKRATQMLESVKLNKEEIQALQEKAKEEVKPDADQVISRMLRFGADLNKCIAALRTILTASGIQNKPLCLIDTVKLEVSVFDNFSVADTKRILGNYIINFLDISRNT